MSMDFEMKMSLKDNMSATMQKNIDLQRQFKQQIDQSNASVKAFGKTDVSATVNLEDNVTKQAREVEEKIREVGRYVAAPVIRIKDHVSSEAEKVGKKLKDLATTYTPIVKIRDLASQGLSKVKNTIGSLGKMVVAPVIAVKNIASPAIEKVKNGLKTVGKTVAKPFIAIKDGATKLIDKVKGGLKAIGSTTAKAAVALKDGASAGLSKIKSMLGTLAKGVTIGVGMAATGAVASMMQGAKLEQSMGGVDTLFKGDAGAVMANADAAYKTAGLSANEYMETVTGFSASLLQSLGGDTAKAVGIADMAIVDMADNANKFGTDMGSIQNAYQGFAKQNYTMLDNLKLGYGGTKEEMERLLVDAAKLSGQQYDISNLSDVYGAIHIIQDQLGVTGTTAKEASETFSGSFAAMKASAQNLLGNLAIGGDVTSSMEQLVDTAATFISGNLVPMVVNIFTALPSAIKTGLSSAAPKIMGALQEALPPSAFNFLTGVFDTAKSVVTTFAPVVQQLGGMFADVGHSISETLGGAFGDGSGLISGFADVISAAIPTIGSLLKGVGKIVAGVMPVFSSLGKMFQNVFPSIESMLGAVIPSMQTYLQSLGGVIQALIPVVSDIIQTFAGVVQQVFPIVYNTIAMVVNAVMPVIQSLAGVIQQMMPLIQNIITVVAGAIQSVMPTISRIFTEVGAKVAEVINTVIVPVVQVLSQIFETVSPIIQSAVEIVAQVFSAAWNIVSPIIDLAMSVFQLLWAVLEPIINSLVDGFTWLWGVLEPIFSGLATGLGWIADGIGSVAGWIGDGISAIGGALGFAYGKDRVPYNDFPAMLHEGEKVLTRNQADQYDRAMSTRGIGLAPAVQEISRDSSSGRSGDTVEAPLGAPAGGAVINNYYNIEQKDFVIRETADVDKVVQDMVTKFRKLVPNMA